MNEKDMEPTGADGGHPGTALGLDQGHTDVEGRMPEHFSNPGLPPHVSRSADLSEHAARRAERQVAALFGISMVATVIFLVAYFAIDQNHLPIRSRHRAGEPVQRRPWSHPRPEPAVHRPRRGPLGQDPDA